MAELGGKQLSTLLESLPGIASVLRSPVADAMVGMIRAAAGLGDFREAEAKELIQYATRRGLMGQEEGDQLLAEIKGLGAKVKLPKAVKEALAPKPPTKAPPAKKAVAKKKTTTVKKKTAKKTVAKKFVKKSKAKGKR